MDENFAALRRTGNCLLDLAVVLGQIAGKIIAYDACRVRAGIGHIVNCLVCHNAAAPANRGELTIDGFKRLISLSGIWAFLILTARMAKKALITGITGQDGSYLAELLLSKGYE